MSGNSGRVPQEFSGAADAELVVKFECKGLEGWQAARKLADLPKKAPSLGALLGQANGLARDGKDEAGALRVFEQALKLYPKEPQLLNAAAWLLVTAKDEKLRDAKRALPLAREAVKLTGEGDGNILDTLAVALHLDGQLAEAVRCAKLAAEKEPDNEEIVGRAKAYAEELQKQTGKQP